VARAWLSVAPRYPHPLMASAVLDRAGQGASQTGRCAEREYRTLRISALRQHPKSVLTWLYRSNSAQMLAELARHDGPLTHEVIGAWLTSGSSQRYSVRYFLDWAHRRSAALIDLAADLPAAVLADLLGVHINTAVRWVRRSKRDWASYLAARGEALPHC
jgi:hypothetical protein